ncbi:hypothetical protein Zm00014a_010870 [Zea mays]|jgi:hypothetical protein|uniref:Uncharacterized protein n=1 Tax=Zea mays TaxID=4577 RepID=A0A3L6FX84_MAIZE|nr:hypothetical protein Zm00014a_010870 [Zea mays]
MERAIARPPAGAASSPRPSPPRPLHGLLTGGGDDASDDAGDEGAEYMGTMAGITSASPSAAIGMGPKVPALLLLGTRGRGGSNASGAGISVEGGSGGRTGAAAVPGMAVGAANNYAVAEHGHFQLD